MRSKLPYEAEKARIKKGVLKSDESAGNNGAFSFKIDGTKLFVVISDGGGWDHVSVSCSHRCPTWKEMGRIKDIFFEEEEMVIQFHPPKSQHVNNHDNCLHLWRSQAQVIEMPPTYMVGLPGVTQQDVKTLARLAN